MKRMRALVLASLLLLSLVATIPSAWAETPIWEEIQQSKSDLIGTASDITESETKVISEIFMLNRTAEEIRVRIAQINTDVALVVTQQTAAETERIRLESVRKDVKEQFARRARYYSENGSFAPIGFLIEANTFSNFLGRLDLLSMVLQRDARLLRDLKDLRAKVQAQESILTSKRAELTDLRARQQAEVTKLAAEVAQRELLLSELKDERGKVEARVNELERLWNTAAKSVLETLGTSLQVLALRAEDIRPDSIQLSLFPPGATVTATQSDLNAFVKKDAVLKGLNLRLLASGDVYLEGDFSGATLSIRGRFSVKNRTVVTYEAKEVWFMEIRMPDAVVQELLSSGRMDFDFSALIGIWAIQQITVEQEKMTVKAGLR